MPIMIYNGGILLDGGAIALDEACCCGEIECPCCNAGTVTQFATVVAEDAGNLTGTYELELVQDANGCHWEVAWTDCFNQVGGKVFLGMISLCTDNPIKFYVEWTTSQGGNTQFRVSYAPGPGPVDCNIDHTYEAADLFQAAGVRCASAEDLGDDFLITVTFHN